MSEIALPKVDRTIVSKKDLIVNNLKQFTDKKNVLSELDEIRPYETDALAAYKNLPLAVVLPENTHEYFQVVQRLKVNFCKQLVHLFRKVLFHLIHLKHFFYR